MVIEERVGFVPDVPEQDLFILNQHLNSDIHSHVTMFNLSVWNILMVSALVEILVEKDSLLLIRTLE